nr:HAD-IC family P-type ATPase [Burkholderia contaminans]
MVSAAAIAGTSAAADNAAHDAHHPNKAAAKAPSKSNRAADDQMQAMRVMHEKMMNAKTPQERAALMDEQMKVMQNGMSMMEMMGAHSSSMPMSSRQGSMEMRMRAQGASVMYLAVDDSLAGLLAVADPIKATTPEALSTLKGNGIRVVMATGDGVVTAKAVAEKLGVDEFHGEVKPADKLDLVTRLQQARHVVAMAGDGINDAPALAKADVGVAMGTGTDVAMSSAQVTLVKGDLRGIARARELSEATVANMKQNLGFAFVYNTLGVPLAAGVLYPFTGLLLSPMIAALAMSLSSASVISNALRLRNAKT